LPADAIHLGIGAIAQAMLLLELFAELAAAAFGEEGVFAVQLHAGLVGLGLLAFTIDAEISGGDALYRGAFVEHLGRGEAGKDLDAERFGLLAEPAADVAEAHHIIAVVLEARRQQESRCLEMTFLAEEEEAILR